MHPATPATRLQSVDLLRGAIMEWLARVLTTIGRVPLIYYLLHIPLIHLSALLVNFIRHGFQVQEWPGKQMVNMKQSL